MICRLHQLAYLKSKKGESERGKLVNHYTAVYRMHNSQKPMEMLPKRDFRPSLIPACDHQWWNE